CVEEQLCSCALCQDVLKDPVSTSCGHWFCRQCITSYWDQSASSGDSSCPQCGKRSRTRPAGQTSSVQCKTLHLYQLKMSPATCHSVYLKTCSQCIQPRGHKPPNHKNQAGTSASSNKLNQLLQQQTDTPSVCEGEVSQVLPPCCCQTVQPAAPSSLQTSPGDLHCAVCLHKGHFCFCTIWSISLTPIFIICI
uniref:RING-type domain-containing protein n=1 Tax=Sparus aurata TaxID=8175 RepID=A0A671X4D0_SPAAU